jgi:hypothetical protein
MFLPLFVLAVILSAAKDPNTVPTIHTARTFSTWNRVPHLRRSLIAPKVGIERSETAFLSDPFSLAPPQRLCRSDP